MPNFLMILAGRMIWRNARETRIPTIRGVGHTRLDSLQARAYLLAVGSLQGAANQLAEEPEVSFIWGGRFTYGTGKRCETGLSTRPPAGKTFRGLEECNQCLAVLKVDPKPPARIRFQIWKKESQAQPADSIALLRLAAIYQRDGLVDKAVAMYEAALKADSKSVPALINLAELYSAKKNPQKAVDLAKAAYRLVPDNPQVR